MATVINNPNDTGSGAGTILGVIVAIILIAVLFIYGLPALRGAGTTTTTGTTGTTGNTPGASANVDVTLPTGNGGSSGTGSTTGQ